MKPLNIVILILGIAVIVGGVYCIMHPGVTDLALVWAMGICLIIDAAALISSWYEIHKLGGSNVWLLVAALISFVFGMIAFASQVMDFGGEHFVAYLMAVWFAISGVLRIMIGVRQRAMRKELGMGKIAKRWFLPLIAGIALVALAVFGVLKPDLLITGLGVVVGIGIIAAGVGLISVAV